MGEQIPVACQLTPPELRERRRLVLEPLRAAALDISASVEENGLVLRFPASAELLAQLAELIDLERRCCPFLRFQLTVEANGAPFSLAISGPPGTAELLTSELGLAAP